MAQIPILLTPEVFDLKDPLPRQRIRRRRHYSRVKWPRVLLVAYLGAVQGCVDWTGRSLGWWR